MKQILLTTAVSVILLSGCANPNSTTATTIAGPTMTVPATFATDAQPTQPTVAVTGYAGFYACVQGLTSMVLQVHPNTGTELEAIFSFGANLMNPSVPFGKFYLRGTIDPASGTLYLLPVSWIMQPPGYVVVGLSGVSRDGGNTFEGNVLSGVGCTAFSIHRI
jgi:hypothetical protein